MTVFRVLVLYFLMVLKNSAQLTGNYWIQYVSWMSTQKKFYDTLLLNISYI